jgi:hypothetical protein
VAELLQDVAKAALFGRRHEGLAGGEGRFEIADFRLQISDWKWADAGFGAQPHPIHAVGLDRTSKSEI